MKNALALFAVLLSSAAAAEEKALPSLELSLKAGGRFPQLMNKLSTSFDATLKVGYAPFETRQLQLFADLHYSQPPQTIAASDPRLEASGADYRSTLLMKDLATTLGVAYFFSKPTQGILPYAGAGVRVHFLRAEVQGAASTDFGQSNETDTRFGATAFGGAGLRLGPGFLLGELALSYAPVEHEVTGRSNVGALSLLLGYGVLL